MASVFDYIFNIGGNFIAQISGMSAAAGNFSAQAEVAQSRTMSLTSALATFSYLKDVFQNVADGVSQLSSAGIKLDSQMHDLSAVAGVTGDGLKQIETFARQSAKAFGTDASVAVEGYKLLLSQLTPELGKYPDALREMGDCIQTTSKLMGGDGVAAAQVLTTAMNQYGVSMEDPTAAAGEMARMMNVMAAAGQAGSAELPAISAALQQCGMAAKAANVSFEETNAAIQDARLWRQKGQRGRRGAAQFAGSAQQRAQIEKTIREEITEVVKREDVFTTLTNNYLSNVTNIITENPAYPRIVNIAKTFEDIKNIIQYNTCLSSFSTDITQIEKSYSPISNFASFQTENLYANTMNYTEVLNSLVSPSYSTNLNYFTNKHSNTTNIFSPQTYTGVNYSTINYEIGEVRGIEPRNEYKYQIPQQIKSEEREDNRIQVVREEERKETLSIEDVEQVVTNMLRREVELCSY